MKVEQFTVEASQEKLRCSLAVPEESLRSEDSGLLLNISATAHYALRDPGQNHPTEPFLKAGHYVLSFDLPHHGERVREYGESLAGMGRALLAGDDPFEQFVADGKAALDGCAEKGIGKGGKIGRVRLCGAEGKGAGEDLLAGFEGCTSVDGNAEEDVAVGVEGA